MAQKVLIFAPLAIPLGALQPLLQERNAEVVLFGSWSDIARHLHDPELTAICLGVGIGTLSGIDCCRQIKQRQAFQKVQIFLVAKASMAEAKEEAIAAGCDHFLLEGEAESFLRDELEKLLIPNERAVSRAALRFHLSGSLFYIEGEEAEVGEILNASRTGILFSSNKQIQMNQEVFLRFQSSNGNEADIKAIVKRLIPLSPGFGEHRFGIGAQFLDLSSSQAEALDWLLAYRDKRVPVWTPAAIQEILSADWKNVVRMLREGISRALLEAFMGDLMVYEQSALSAENAEDDLLLELLALRLQCCAFSTFVPEMRRAPHSIEAAVLIPLKELMSRLTDVEERAERRILEKSNVAFSDVQPFIESSDRLHTEKLRLFFTIDESISSDGLDGVGAETLALIRQKVNHVRNLQRVRESN